MKFKTNFQLQHYTEAFLRILYPADCAVCAKMLELEERIVCANCAQALSNIVRPLEDAWINEKFEFLDNAWAVYDYKSPIKELLHGVKYFRKDYLLKICFSPALAVALAVTTLHDYHAILPIPLHRFKLVYRHFNQSEVLAKMLCPHLTPPFLNTRLKKTHPIPSQTFLNREERAINIYGAFRVRQPRQAAGRSFLLIDDVFTTGATANEAARALKYHGAKRVDLLALAKTMSTP